MYALYLTEAHEFATCTFGTAGEALSFAAHLTPAVATPTELVKLDSPRYAQLRREIARAHGRA